MTEITVIASKKFYKNGDSYITTGGFGKVIESIAKFFDKIKLAVPVKFDDSFNGYEIKSKNIEYIELPFYENEKDFIFLSNKIKKQINQIVEQSELIHGWLPGYETWHAYQSAMKHNKKMMVYCGGDWEWISHYWKFKHIKWLTNMYANYNHNIVKTITSNVPTFFMGEELYDKYSDCKYAYKTRNSTLSKNDIYKYRDTCKNKKIKLLCVGRLNPEKRFDTALIATRELNKENLSVILQVVGDGPEKNNLIDKYTIVEGMIPQGSKLTNIYRDADIFVFPSHENSIAKVCLEAMANGLPIICTNEGAFPKEISDDKHCILINKDSPTEIMYAVKEIINNKKLRQQMIKQNLKDVNNYLIDNIVEQRLKIAGFIE